MIPATGLTFNCERDIACLPEAIELVLARDLPDELLPEAFIAQASLMARVNPEEFRGSCSD